jgi:hypothetical protein
MSLSYRLVLLKYFIVVAIGCIILDNPTANCTATRKDIEVVPIETAIESLKKVLPERYNGLIQLNKSAMEKGMELVEKVTVS